MRLRWCGQLYTDERAGAREQWYRWRLEHGAGCPGMYVITVSTHEQMLLDIVPALAIRQEPVRRRLSLIVGLAFGKGSAWELAARIVSDVYRETSGTDVRGYFREERQKG